MAVMSQVIGSKLVKVLGLPSCCTSITIRLAAGEPVEVIATFYTGEIEGDALVEAMNSYGLVSIEEQPAMDRIDAMANAAKAEISAMAHRALAGIYRGL